MKIKLSCTEVQTLASISIQCIGTHALQNTLLELASVASYDSRLQLLMMLEQNF